MTAANIVGDGAYNVFPKRWGCCAALSRAWAVVQSRATAKPTTLLCRPGLRGGRGTGWLLCNPGAGSEVAIVQPKATAKQPGCCADRA